MGSWLFFVTLLGLTFSVHGQTLDPPPPPPTPSIPVTSGEIPEGPITSLAGDIQVVINDQLRGIMAKYGITPEEIRKMLDLYARGGSPTITKSRTNPDTGLQETITLDFEEFASKSRSGDDDEASQVKSVSPSADPLPGQPTSIPKPGDGPSDTSPPPRQITLTDLQDAATYKRNQISELDAQLSALDNAYRTGQITRYTRNENAVRNRERRRQSESDLRLLEREITRMKMPTGRRKVQREAKQVPTSEPLQLQQPPVIVPRQVGSTSPSYEALRRELLQIRARERYILRRLQVLAARNPGILMRGRMPNPRNVFLGRRPMTRRITFGNTPRFSSRRALTGNVAGGRVQNPRTRLF